MWRRISSFPLRGVEGRLRAHMKLVLMATELLRDLIEGCISYNWSVVQSVAENIAMTEREADDVKRGWNSTSIVEPFSLGSRRTS